MLNVCIFIHYICLAYSVLSNARHWTTDVKFEYGFLCGCADLHVQVDIVCVHVLEKDEGFQSCAFSRKRLICVVQSSCKHNVSLPTFLLVTYPLIAHFPSSCCTVCVMEMWILRNVILWRGCTAGCSPPASHAPHRKTSKSLASEPK